MMNEWILSSCVLIVLVLLGRWLLRGKISLRLQYGLWAVVLVRLLLPVQIFTSDFGTGSIAKEVDIAEPVRQVYAAANENRYEREYDEAYQQVVAEYTAQSIPIAPDAIEKIAYTRTQERQELDLSRLLYGVWFAGMGVMGAVIIGCNLHLSRQLKRRRWELDVPDSLLPVYITEAVPTPCVFGVFRPAIYLTPDAAKEPRTRTHVLTHELTHYRHFDHVWSVLRSFCLVLHWYNPLVWAAAKVSRADAELACDEGALIRLGEDQRGDYGRTLIGLTCSAPISALFVTATTMTGSAGSIRERIKLLMRKPRNTVLTLTAVIVMVTLIVGCTFSGAPETTTETTEPGLDNDMSYTGQELPIPEDPGADNTLSAVEQAMDDYADKNPRILTPEEIEQVNEAFASTVYNAERDEYMATGVAAFFTSDYKTVEELDFAEFLRYFPVSGEATEEEFQLLRQKYGTDFEWAEHETLQDMPVPVHRFDSSDIDAVTRRYANLPVQEIQNKDAVYYLEETDAYYNFTSDFGPGKFPCVEGFVYDGGAILYSTYSALFLTETAGQYTITAYLSIIGESELEFGSTPYFEALLNPQMYRTEADWYPLALNSFYDTPAQIDLYQLFYTGLPGVDNTLSAQEQAFLESCPGYAPNYDTDRLPAAEMNRVLETYFGISLDQTAGIGLEHFFYWEEQDCYYHSHSDSNLQFRQIIDCQNLGGGVWYIRYTNDQQEQGGVTMQYTGGIWKVLSNARISDEQPALTVHGDLFNADGVLVYPGVEFFQTEEEVLSALGITRAQCHEYQKTSGDGMTANSFAVSRSDAFGVPIRLCFTFRSYWPDEEPVLTEVYGSFDNRADFEAVRQLYADTLGETDGQDTPGTEEWWKSDITLGDLVGGAGYEILNRCAPAGDAAMRRPASWVEWISDGSITWFTELPVPQTDEVRALFEDQGNTWYLAALTTAYTDPDSIDPAAFFSADPSSDPLTDAEKTLITQVYGEAALKKPLFRMDAWLMDEILQTYLSTDTSFLDLSGFLYCPETQNYLMVREEIPVPAVPEILSCEQLADNQVRMIYRFFGEEQTWCATLLYQENWKVYSNLPWNAG